MICKRSSVLRPMNRKVSPFGQSCSQRCNAVVAVTTQAQKTLTQQVLLSNQRNCGPENSAGVTVFYFSVFSCHLDTAQCSLRNCTAKWLFHSLGLLARELGKGVWNPENVGSIKERSSRIESRIEIRSTKAAKKTCCIIHQRTKIIG